MAVLLVLVGFVSGRMLSAQTLAASGLPDYTVTSWTDANGLRLGAIYAIAQDAEGYLWLGTDTGLLRFDGLRFSRWMMASDTQFPDARVSALFASPVDKSIWVATSAGGGVYRIQGNRLLRTDSPGEGLDSVIGLAGNRHGVVVAVTDVGVFQFKDGVWQRLARGLPATGILSAYFDNQDQLFVGTTRGLLRRLQGADHFESVAPWWSFSTSRDRLGRLWTTDIRTGFRPVGDDLRLPPRGNGYRILHDRDGRLWVATIGQGLWRVIHGSREVSVEKVAGLLSDSVESLIEDREGNIWAGTTGGLHRLSRRLLTPVDVGFVVAAEDDGQGMWAGTWLGLMRLHTRDGSWYAEPRSPGNFFVRAMHRDSSGTLWFASTRGLGRVVNDGIEWMASPHQDNANFSSVVSDASGRVLTTDGRRLFQVSGSKVVPSGSAEVVGVNQITQLYSDRHGQVWVTADEGKRLGILDHGGVFRAVFDAPGENATIYAVYQDREGLVWIAHSNGLTRLGKSTPHSTIDSSNGLPGNRVWALVEDDDDGLWLSMDLGLVRLPRKEFDQAVLSRSHRVRYQLFDAADGLAGAPLRNVRASRAADGTLWFIRGGSLTVLDPRLVIEKSRLPAGPVRIESVVTNEETLAVTPNTTLAAGTKRLEINYTAVTLTSPTKVRFRYRLDGFDADWVDAGTRREAVYTNLAPGNYTFRVEGISVEGGSAESAATWSFTISPTFYQTRAFVVLMAGFALAVILGVWRLRLRLVRREFDLVLAERTRISQEVHDTLLQSLVGMSFQFDDLYNSVSEIEPAIRNRLLQARRLVQAHIREARRSIADLRSPARQARGLEYALREFAAKTAAGTSTSVVFKGLPGRNGIPSTLDNQLIRIGQEAITNAIHHAGAKQIEVELVSESRSVRLRVSDDGCGFDPDESVSGHYGLIMMRERVEQIGGTLTVASSPGTGTTVEALVPLPAA